MRKPKVVLLKSTLSALGGLEKFSRYFATAFADKGFETLFLTTQKGEIPIANSSGNVKIISLGTKKKPSVLQLINFDYKCKKWLDKHPSEIIFGLDRNRHQTHLRAGNGVHAFYLDQRKQYDSFFKSASFLINPLHRFTLQFEKTAFEDPNLKVLFTNSQLVKDQILHYYKVDPKKIQVVHNGVEWNQWQESFDCSFNLAPQLKKQWGLSLSAFQLLFVGNGFRRKGLIQLLQGLSLLKRDDVQLSIVGKDKELCFFKDLVGKLGLSKNVFFFGPQPSTIPFYQFADCLAIPSIYDPFANVTVEALAMGLFVLSSPYNGGSEILTPLSGKIISDIKKPECIADAISFATRRPKTLQQALTIRKTVMHLEFNHQLSKIIDSTVNL